MFEPGTYRIAVDLMRVRGADGKVFTTRAWGDRLRVTGGDADGIDVFVGRPGRVRKPPKSSLLKDDAARTQGVLRLDFVDVQQGDATVLETANGTTMLIDGGENVLFSRYLAGRFAGSSLEQPRAVDCIVVTHGDADHFAGLTEIHRTEKATVASKRLFLAPQRIFHNGLVKRTGGLGTRDGDLVTELHDDLRPLPDNVMNPGFRAWRNACKAWATRNPAFEMRRVQRGDDACFDFLAADGVEVKVLGPVTVPSDGGAPGLPWLGSIGETINGHSVVLQVKYKRVHFLLAGDLNAAAEKTFVAEHDAGRGDLGAEVLKVPHHGSADYLPEFLARVAPVVSVVSSGDEGASDHIHPRATLLGALGRYARAGVERPVIFITELAAFFRFDAKSTDGTSFKRDAFGIVRCRTDGERLLVYTDAGESGKNEAYAFTVRADGTLEAARVRTVS